jgi:cation diffusion facilitator family transporter
MGLAEESARVSSIGLICTILLFIVKLGGSIVSGSLALISDTMNSFLDIFSYSAIHMSTKMSHKRPDREHPFGHRRAQPIAGLIIAIFAGILAFEILKEAMFELLFPTKTAVYGFIPLAALFVAICVKIAMVYYFKGESERLSSPALKAAYIDSRNDILSSSIALVGVLGGTFGIPYFDDVAALLIGLYILYSGYDMGKENIDYLVGKKPPEELMKAVRAKMKGIKGIVNVHNVRAHYVGDVVEVEAHVTVSQKMSIKDAHGISEEARHRVETLPEISRAFIHIEVD